MLPYISRFRPGNHVFFTWKTWNLVLKSPDYPERIFYYFIFDCSDLLLRKLFKGLKQIRDSLAFGEEKSQIISDMFLESYKAKILKVCEPFTLAK